MSEVGAYEAKTHLSQLLERVARGDRVVITKHGVPVAVLAPVGRQTDPERVATALRRFRKGNTLKPNSVCELIEEGWNGS